MISVIIPSARPDRLPLLLAVLQKQDHDDRIEIIVVTPRRDEPIELDGVHVVETDRLYPPGRMRNAGASASSGEILFFIDDDCLPSHEWISGLKSKLLALEKAGAVGCRVVGTPESFWTRCADFCLFASYQFVTEQETDLGSAAIAVSRKAFHQAGGFDEGLLASEDWDFCLKLRSTGWRCYFDPSVEVMHDHRRGTLMGILGQSFNSGFESGLEIQRRHYALMSLPARLAVLFGSPWLYWMVVLPYAALVAFSQFAVAMRQDSRAFLYGPVILLSRLLYQVGVMRRLISLAVQ